MKLNNECVRDVLIQCEILLKMDESGRMEPLMLEKMREHLEGYDDATIKYTVKKLKEAGLIDAEILETKVIISSGKTIINYYIFDITNKGHEFLNNIRNDTNWNKVKNIAQQVGSFSLSVLGEIAKNVITTSITNVLMGGCM